MQAVQPNSNVLLPTTPPFEREEQGSRITMIAVLIIASLGSLICLPFKLSIGVSVVFLATGYWIHRRETTEPIKPPSLPQSPDRPAPAPAVATVLPTQQWGGRRSPEPIQIEVIDRNRMICYFSTSESQKAFLNDSWDQIAHVTMGEPGEKKALLTPKNRYDVVSILSHWCSLYPQEGRPTSIQFNNGFVVCKFKSSRCVTNFLEKAENLKKSPSLSSYHDKPSIIIKSSLDFSPWDIYAEIARILVNQGESSS